MGHGDRSVLVILQPCLALGKPIPGVWPRCGERACLDPGLLVRQRNLHLTSSFHASRHVFCRIETARERETKRARETGSEREKAREREEPATARPREAKRAREIERARVSESESERDEQRDIFRERERERESE